MQTITERLHQAVVQGQQVTLIDGGNSHVVIAIDPNRVDLEVWAVLQADLTSHSSDIDNLSRLWKQQAVDTATDVGIQTHERFAVPGFEPASSVNEQKPHPVPAIFSAGTVATPSSLSEGFWRGPALHALEEQARDIVAQRLSGEPLNPLHDILAGAKWAQSAVEGPLSAVVVTLGRRVETSVQEVSGKVQSAWNNFLQDVEQHR